MKELSSTSRTLLDAARRHTEPTPEEWARHRKRLAVQLGATAVGAATAAELSSSANVQALGAKAVATAKSGVVSGIIHGFGAPIVGCALLALSYVGVRAVWNSGEPHHAASSVHASASPQVARPLPSALPEEVPASEALPPPASSASAPASLPVRQPSPRQSSTPPKPNTDLDAELAVLQAAGQALRAGDPRAALRILNTRAAARGNFSTERRALRIVARCALREPGATDDARAFLKSAGSSPLAARVARGCGL